MNDQERLLAKFIRELEVGMIKSAANIDEKRDLLHSINVLSEQLTLIVGRRIIKETYKNGQTGIS